MWALPAESGRRRTGMSIIGIGAIAMTTGEVDAVYHVMFDEMAEAIQEVGTREQKERWLELTTQGRLRGYNTLPEILTST
ncbi:NgoMIV family type II restriction endonuclease [Micromonospora sp. NPDC023737]|uniref:NgoMIV family type II restriction endonuclease n=1 Tax=unclassified Micromonospora TaxID=2617518 RepID=UPI0033D86E31